MRDESALSPSAKPNAPRSIDFPAPVSPVITFMLGLISSSKWSTSFKDCISMLVSTLVEILRQTKF